VEEGPAFFDYKPKEFQLFVTTDKCSLFQLGTVTRPNFNFRVTIQQPVWGGNPGIFWGFHPEDPSRFQCLYLEKRAANPIPRDKENYLDWGMARLVERQNNRLIETDLITSQVIPNPLGEQTLEITVRNHNLAKVSINGNNLENLPASKYAPKFLPRDFQGGLGIYNVTNGGTFKEAIFQWFPGTHEASK
jgi:hypothetical protein